MATQIQLRRDTSSNWTANNPTLAAGEFAWESDTNRFKIGDGTTAWTSLGYASDGDTAGITFVGDDSTGTLVAQNETFKIAGTQNITTAVAGDTVTITGPDLTAYSTFSGSYADLTNKPTIPTNNTELTNGAGYITGYSVTEGDVTAHQAALSITESQITDLTHFSGSYTDLTNKPTIPTNNTELTNGAGYITGVSFADVTGKPTTTAGYGITDAFSGSYTDLTNKPTLFSGSYTDLTNKPTIPSALTDLSITDGTSGQVLTTDGAGGFTFTTVSGGGGGGSTGDLVITNSTINTASNANLYLTADGSGIVNVAVNGAGLYDSPSADRLAFDAFVTDSAFAAMARGNRMHYEETGYNITNGRLYGNAITNYVKLDGTSSNSSNDRIRNIFNNVLDVNGATLGQTSTSRGAVNYLYTHTYNSAASAVTTGTAGTQYFISAAGHGTLQAADHTFTNQTGLVVQPYALAPSGFQTNIANATGLQVSYGQDGTRTNINYTGTARGISISAPFADSVYSSNSADWNNWIGLDVNNAGGDKITGNNVAISYNGSYTIQNNTIGNWGLFDGDDGSQNKISGLKIHNNGNGGDVRLDRYNNYGGHIYIDGQRWPNAAGSEGQVLQTNSNGELSWTTVDALPSQSNNAGKYLTTDGGNASWATLDISNWSANVDGNGYELSDVVLKNYKESIYDRNPTGNGSPIGLTEGTVTPDAAQGSLHYLTLTDDITINGFANAVAGQTITLIITQPASGAHSLISTMKFAGGYKTLTAQANAVDILTITYDGTTYWASLASDYQ